MPTAETAGPADDAREPAPGAGGPVGRLLELGGLLLLLLFLGITLAAADRPLPFSDPATWHSFGMNFADSFASEPLAYLFPLYLAAAVAVVGPVTAFLANVPVLVALATTLYGFTRQVVRPAAVAPVAAITALGWVVAIDRKLLIALCSPYREPLALTLLLLASVLFVAIRTRAANGLTPAWASGSCLALACSARETSVLMVVPFLVYALASRRQDPALPLRKPALAFAAGFSLAILPLLCQNFLISGNPLVPGQSAASMQSSGVLFGGLALSNLPSGLSRTFGFLADHYGIVGGVLIALGAAAAVRRRLGVALYLVLPAFATYAVFWSCYAHTHPIPRYLFVLDLLVAPLTGLGAAFVAEAALRALEGKSVQRWLKRAAAALAFLFATSAIWTLRGVDHERPIPFRMAHGEVIRSYVLEHLPADARIVAAFPFGEMIQAFASDHVELYSTRDPLRHVADALGDAGSVYLVSNEDMLAATDANRRFARWFAVERVDAFEALRWGFRVPGRPILYVDRVRLRARDGGTGSRSG